MSRQILILVACITGLLLGLSASMRNIGVSQEQPQVQLEVKQLQKLAQSITVKVRSPDVLGSGIVINRQGAVYTVLTNNHVLVAGEPPYQVETPDAKIHPATKLPISLGDNDLALLQFRSADTVYAVASLGAGFGLQEGEEVFAAGYPFQYWIDESPPTMPTPSFQSEEKLEGFVLRTGKIFSVLDRALEGGYRVGYTNDIQKGMSGGPLLNREGEVVAVNGMHAEPLWGNPYIYKDGSEPSLPQREEMSRYSWGIPIETFVGRSRSLFVPTQSNNKVQ